MCIRDRPVGGSPPMGGPGAGECTGPAAQKAADVSGINRSLMPPPWLLLRPLSEGKRRHASRGSARAMGGGHGGSYVEH
eukprot:9487265-Alexandrium_andersonii.AAC.1